MKQWIYKLIFTAGGCALLAQPALAQPKTQDHRKAPQAAPAPAAPAAPVTRDHRDDKGKAGGPKVRDHRDDKDKAAGPKVRDHRDDKGKAAGPKVRDHRDDKGKAAGPEVRDHRDDKGKAAGPEVRDHRDDKGHEHAHPDHGKPTTSPEVRDHRTPVTAPVGASDRRNEVVPSRRGKKVKRWSNYEIPVVKRYWPDKGDVGTTVTVHGANFTPGLAVYLGETAITGATITPTSISFAIPAGVAKGMISLRGDRRPLAIGAFEVASYDAKAEAKKRWEERRKLAESNWKARKKELAGDREARLLALQEREAALQESRAQRRSERRAEIRANFEAAFLADEATLAEFALHAERVARLERMQRLAEANDSGKLIIRIDVAIAEENDRHTARLATLKATSQNQ